MRKSSALTRENDVSHWWWIESVRLARRENGWWWWCVEATGTSRQMAEHKRRAGARFMVPAKSEFWIVVGHDWFSHHGVRKVRLCVKACTAVGEGISRNMWNHYFQLLVMNYKCVTHSTCCWCREEAHSFSPLTTGFSVLFLLRSCSQSHLDTDKKKVYFNHVLHLFFVHRIHTLHPVSHIIHPRCPKGLNLCQISLAVDSKPITVAPPVHPNRFVVWHFTNIYTLQQEEK